MRLKKLSPHLRPHLSFSLRLLLSQFSRWPSVLSPSQKSESRNRVWILKRHWHYEGGDEVIDVYDTEEKALDAKELADRISDTTIGIQKWIVK